MRGVLTPGTRRQQKAGRRPGDRMHLVIWVSLFLLCWSSLALLVLFLLAYCKDRPLRGHHSDLYLDTDYGTADAAQPLLAPNTSLYEPV
jgi:hypothetical protein